MFEKLLKDHFNIGLITPPLTEAAKVPLSNLAHILCAFSNNTYVITGNEGHVTSKENEVIYIHKIDAKVRTNALARILNSIWIQLRISYKLVRLVRKVNLWIFFVGGEYLLLPMLAAKSLRKRVIIAPVGFMPRAAQLRKDHLYQMIGPLMTKINYSLSDKIILHSPILIKEWNLEKYKDKTSIAHEYFLDFNKFKINNKFDERENLIGYIGRLSIEKGVLNFVKAIPSILKEKEGLGFLIGGDGQLRDEIEEYLENESLNDKVKLEGWIPHDELPNYMNELKLLVIPSYMESGPIIALEAMACGTPILATRTGHVLEMIEAGENGFIMENNSPACIAKNVIRALEYPNLEEIAQSARGLVEREFTYEVAVERYRDVLSTLNIGERKTDSIPEG
ncbi:glycosyltransferase family 4 protein [Chloroflexota bacterium]